MSWSWTNATTGVVTAAWGQERSRAIEQISKDIYESPQNDNDGLANLSYPLERLRPIVSGIVETTEPGVSVSLGVTIAEADYIVDLSWQEDPGSTSGIPFAEKTTTGFVIKVSGSGVGKKIGYTAKRRV